MTNTACPHCRHDISAEEMNPQYVAANYPARLTATCPHCHKPVTATIANLIHTIEREPPPTPSASFHG